MAFVSCQGCSTNQWQWLPPRALLSAVHDILVQDLTTSFSVGIEMLRSMITPYFLHRWKPQLTWDSSDQVFLTLTRQSGENRDSDPKNEQSRCPKLCSPGLLIIGAVIWILGNKMKNERFQALNLTVVRLNLIPSGFSTPTWAEPWKIEPVNWNLYEWRILIHLEQYSNTWVPVLTVYLQGSTVNRFEDPSNHSPLE